MQRVIVAGPAQMNLWRQVFADGSGSATSGGPSVRTVTLRRYDVGQTLRVWSLETNMFTSEERRAQLLQVDGRLADPDRSAQRSWSRATQTPVDSAAWMNRESLRHLEAELATPTGAAELIAAVGLSHDGAAVPRVRGNSLDH